MIMWLYLKVMGMEWFKMILKYSGCVMIPYTGDILQSILNFIQMDSDQINMLGEANAESKT